MDAQNGTRVPTGALNEMLARATARMQPPVTRASRLKIFYITQISTRPADVCGLRQLQAAVPFLLSAVSDQPDPENFGLEHTPIRLVIRQRGTGSVGAKDV